MSDDRIAALEARVAKLERFAARLQLAIGGKSSTSDGADGGRVASDRELDDPNFGDEVVRKDPPRWKGDSYQGHRMSACSPEYLDELASFCDWAAEKEKTTAGKEKYAKYSEGRAAKSRGWAKRLRAGWKPPQAAIGNNEDRGDAWEGPGPF